MRVGVGADHGGFEMKEQLAKLLAEGGYQVVDFGNKIYDKDDDYPDFAIPLARAVASGEVERGIFVCGSGVGASVAANKVGGARAALCHDDFSARQGSGGRRHEYSLFRGPYHGSRRCVGLREELS
ncbi:RpiB/LacA/LacB family sugar-phosphate isomerase [Edaphobacter aggregans]|uniref:RpiB/LacA/LacB family sugar-phosphate isomerase n=1 Tax=Edaphobacter aggregans TaxID=570835 RepID=UPI001B809809|nr:RpiB/LacA/LacB family sugar-phosphate isomerase [Edaphobacter aggregans]